MTTTWTQLSRPRRRVLLTEGTHTHGRNPTTSPLGLGSPAAVPVERVKNTACVNLTFNPVRCWCRSDGWVYNATNRGRQLSRRPWFMVAVAAAHDQPPAILEDRANTARQTVRSVRCPPLSRTLEIFDCWQPFRLPRTAQVWNGLPEAVVSSSLLQASRSQLKTHLRLPYHHLIVDRLTGIVVAVPAVMFVI